MEGSHDAAVALIWRHAEALFGAGLGGASPRWVVDELGYRVLQAVDRAERGVATTADAVAILVRLVSQAAAVEAGERAICDAEAEAVGLRVLLGVEGEKVAELAAEVDRLRRPSLRAAAGVVAAWIRGGRS